MVNTQLNYETFLQEAYKQLEGGRRQMFGYGVGIEEQANTAVSANVRNTKLLLDFEKERLTFSLENSELTSVAVDDLNARLHEIENEFSVLDTIHWQAVQVLKNVGENRTLENNL